MQFDEEFKYYIAIENAPISPHEREKIKEILNEQGIDIAFLEQRGFVNSIFTSIPIYLNPEIVSLMINGLMVPAFYDALKRGLYIMVSKISTRIHKTDPAESGAAFKLKVGQADLYAEIPSDLNNEQFSLYMDLVKDTVSTLSKSNENIKTNYQQLFMMYNSDDVNIEVKTVQEYAEIQKKKKQQD